MNTKKLQTTRTRTVRVLSWLSLLTGMGVALFFWIPSRGSDPTASEQPGAVGSLPPGVAVRNIEDLRVGDRVLAHNPLLRDDEHRIPDPLADEWCSIDLAIKKQDGSRLDITLLRPLDWLEEYGATVGGTMLLDIPEMNTYGESVVLGIAPCPPIEPGAGRVVIGTFRHTSSEVIELSIEGLDEPIGTTIDHPIWSEDRHAFVEANKLKIGERLRTQSGQLRRLTNVTSRGPPETVYNLQVHAEHVYYVSRAGILVHNYQKKTQNGATYELRPSKGGSGPNRWQRATGETHTSSSGLEVTVVDGVAVRWKYKVGTKGTRGSKYRSVDPGQDMHRGHVKAVNEGAGLDSIDDGPLNIIPQTSKVNLSNVKRFENWRVTNAQGAEVIVEQLDDGMIRTRIPSKNIDVTYDPLSNNKFVKDWFQQGGVHL